MLRLFLSIAVAITLTSCQETAPCPEVQAPIWQLVYAHDAEGNAVTGNKSDLIRAVRNGLPLRIGFGGRGQVDTMYSVEHTADVQFTTIANGEEVFGQITSIIGQNPALESDTLGVTFRERLNWTIMVGTNGFSDRLMVDRFENIVSGHRTRFMRARWYVFATASQLKQEAEPLW